MATVAIGWQVYELTGSPLYLGLAGLTQFLPTAIFVFVAGHIADRHDRRRVMHICQLAQCMTAGFLAVCNLTGWLTVPIIFLGLLAMGTAAAFENPATAALLPNAAPEGGLQQANVFATAGAQIASIGGPTLGGLSYAISPTIPYVAMTALWLFASVLTISMYAEPQPRDSEPPLIGTLFEGVHFVRNNPLVLGTVTLDLFAVLFGGATALMPIFARDILQTGPWGLGILRAAPALGALIMTIILARWRLKRHVGLRMIQAVIIFGGATCAFAVSHQFWLSIFILAIMGAADAVSVVIQLSLVQLATPDRMRGRVGAVSFLFINASNQLGEFESGVTAAMVGAQLATMIGGIGCMAVGMLWMKLFPSLKNTDQFQQH